MDDNEIVFDDLIIGIPASDITIDINDNDFDNRYDNIVIRIDNDDDDNDIHTSKEKVFDSNLDIFPILTNGIGYPIFIFNILPYLTTVDLFTVLSISRHLQQVNFSSKYWKHFTNRDFCYPSLQYVCPNLDPEYELLKLDADYDSYTNDNDDLNKESGVSYSDYRLNYVNRFYEMKERINRSRLNQELENKMSKLQGKVKNVECFLDLTQVRILIPLILSSLFSSIILFALYFDGMDINIWICASPILFAFFYLYVCMFIARLVYYNQANESSIFYNLWDNMRGPIRILYTEGLGESATFTYLIFSYTVLFLIQVILLTFKFDSTSIISQTLNWPTIFLPVWISYFLYLTLPLYVALQDGFGGYIGGIILFWIPSLVFFICLVVKLAGAASDKFSLKVIFFPFWFLEGIFMISTLTYLCFGCTGNIRQDNRLDENVETFLSTWLSMAPFVIFQSLLSARDDNRKGVSTIDAMIPVLICVGWLFLASIVSVYRFRSPYDDSRAAKKKDEAGRKILFSL